MNNYNNFWITYSNGEVLKVDYPTDWTAEEVLKNHAEYGAVEVDGPYPA